MSATWSEPATHAGHYADVNGIKLYYEIHGTGRPAILLHGGLGAIDMFGDTLPALATHRQIIGVDLQGHGRTADIDRPLRADLMADDIAALIKHVKLDRPDLVGFSLGGAVAVHTAARHPALVGRLVAISTPFKRTGYYPEILAQQQHVSADMAEAMKATPMYQLYSSVAPHPQGLAAPARQDRGGDAGGFRLLQGHRRHQGDDIDRCRRCRHLPAVTRGRDVRAAWRWTTRSRLGWFGAPEVEAGNSSRPHPLQHRRSTIIGRYSERVSR